MNDDGHPLEQFACPVTLPAQDKVLLGHGSGGRLSTELLQRVFMPAFQSLALDSLNDQALVDVDGVRLAFTTDSFVVNPLFFPGGDIGSLAVYGTINDLAMGGAEPLFLSAAFILEEGLLLATLEQVVASFSRAAQEAGVAVITGDTKVVEKGKGDGLFINTSGIGRVPPGINLSADQARPGDCILLSGSIGEHGIAILSQRQGLEFESPIRSDCAPLHRLVAAMLAASPAIRCMRDPTRGGVSSALRGACELLGLDPLYVANEGKLVAIVDAAQAERILAAMRAHPLGQQARIIGRVTESNPGLVMMRTSLGTTRIVDMLSGDQLP